LQTVHRAATGSRPTSFESSSEFCTHRVHQLMIIKFFFVSWLPFCGTCTPNRNELSDSYRRRSHTPSCFVWKQLWKSRTAGYHDTVYLRPRLGESPRAPLGSPEDLIGTVKSYRRSGEARLYHSQELPGFPTLSGRIWGLWK